MRRVVIVHSGDATGDGAGQGWQIQAPLFGTARDAFNAVTDTIHPMTFRKPSLQAIVAFMNEDQPIAYHWLCDAGS